MAAAYMPMFQYALITLNVLKIPTKKSIGDLIIQPFELSSKKCSLLNSVFKTGTISQLLLIKICANGVMTFVSTVLSME
jgi:hypothetical protein